MIMSWIFTGIVFLSILGAVFLGNGQALAAAIPQGAQGGITLAISLGGGICLWSGVGHLMEKVGVTAFLSRLFRPVLHRLFPSTNADPLLAGHVSANICANLLGLGNAATPMGILAVKGFSKSAKDGIATAEMCRFIVLNTASIQLIPATVAAVRSGLGSASPFDILPAVWVTSLCAATVGLLVAWLLDKVWSHD